MEIVTTNLAPAAIGPYSQAIISNNLVFVSGQMPIDPKSGEIVENTIEAQTKQVMKNISAILEASGSSLDKAVKTTCYLADMQDFAVFNEIYSKWFTKNPARACIAVRTLPKNVICEVDVIAEI